LKIKFQIKRIQRKLAFAYLIQNIKGEKINRNAFKNALMSQMKMKGERAEWLT
jgi:hypothetical protein